MRGVTSFEKARKALLDLFNPMFLSTVARTVISHHIVHVRVDLFCGYLYGAHSLRQFLEFYFPALDDFL